MVPPQLTAFEAAHAASIGDTNVVLAPTPPAWQPKILVASIIRKPPVVVEALLQTLAWQRLRRATTLSYAFITDFPASDPNAAPVKALLTDFSKSRQNVTIRHNTAPSDTSYGDTATTRHWEPSAFRRVGALKNEFLQRCMDAHADYLWLVDADVLCDPTTLQSLLDAETPIVAGVYWTHWQKPQPGDTMVVHAGPQVWLRHPYQLSGHGYSEADFRFALVGRQLLRVWGLGACTLFSRHSLEKGVSFAPVPEGLPGGPMSDGEDRHLSERARRLHIPLFADGWPNIYHAYHAADYNSIAGWLTRLAAPAPQRPTAETLVSAKLEMLEPVPTTHNPQFIQHVPPQFVRGRLGTLPVLPEIAEALAGMQAGERRLVSLHYPVHYAYPTLRLQTRLAAVTLLDIKPYNLPPTIGQEMFSGNVSWKTIDMTTLAEAQVRDLEAEATPVTV